MKRIMKGAKATGNGVFLSVKEYDELINYKNILLALKEYKKDYDRTYKSYLM